MVIRAARSWVVIWAPAGTTVSPAGSMIVGGGKEMFDPKGPVWHSLGTLTSAQRAPY